jgi:4-amino-4-deoxy-L-arabinose transferase-like glycosyltransferase
MESASRKDFAYARLLVGAVAFVCAVTFYYLAVLKVDYHNTSLLDLGQSDATHYFAQAKALLRYGLPSVQIGYDKMPSLWPAGYPALMLPWLKILPETDSILAPFRTNQTIGLLLLFGVFGFYLYLAMPLTGGFAALLLATLPGFFTFCRSPMSDVSASAFVALAFMFAYLGLKEERRWKIYLSAAFLGLSLNIRLQSIFFVPLLLAMTLFPVEGSRVRWLLHCLALPIVFALAASPLLVLNTIQFHSPLQTGYDYYLNPVLGKVALFSWRYIPDNAALLWRELALRPQKFTAMNLFGTGTCFVAAFILLACVGVFFIRLNRFVFCAFSAGLSFFALIISLFPVMYLGYYLPLLMLLVALAVLPVTWAVENLVLPKRTTASLAIFVLFAAAALGYPSRSVDLGLKAERLQSWEALHFSTRPRPSAEFIAQQRFIESVGQAGGLVFSDISPVYLNALFAPGFVAAPLDGKRYIQWRHVVHYDDAQAVALAKLSLHRSIPVYALFVSTKEFDEKASRLPNVPGYRWVPEDTTNAAVILRLTSTQ